MINNTVLVGRLTKEVEVRKTQSGKSVVSFNLAVNRTYKKEGEQNADFISCVAWNGQADFMGNYLSKGALVGIVGRLQTRTYDDEHTGKKVYVTEVVVESLQALESRAQREAGNTTSSTGNSYASAIDDSPVLNITNEDLPF